MDLGVHVLLSRIQTRRLYRNGKTSSDRSERARHGPRLSGKPLVGVDCTSTRALFAPESGASPDEVRAQPDAVALRGHPAGIAKENLP
jgi:hypothetical protein